MGFLRDPGQIGQEFSPRTPQYFRLAVDEFPVLQHVPRNELYPPHPTLLNSQAWVLVKFLRNLTEFPQP